MTTLELKLKPKVLFGFVYVFVFLVCLLSNLKIASRIALYNGPHPCSWIACIGKSVHLSASVSDRGVAF